MSDVKLERKEPVSREDAAVWLELLSQAFAKGSHIELPFGPGTVSLEIPDQVRAEFEIEVDGDEVEVELEFKWSTDHRDGVSLEKVPAATPGRSRRGNAAAGPGGSPRPRGRQR
jgi:amphi-Trp domain-containing protein